MVWLDSPVVSLIIEAATEEGLMAKDENRRVHSDVIDRDRTALVALQALNDYEPRQPGHSVQALLALNAEVEESRQAEMHAENELAAVRTRAIAAEWALHNAMLGVKSEIVVQYGADSHAIEAMGLKKKSDRKRPRRKTAAEVKNN